MTKKGGSATSRPSLTHPLKWPLPGGKSYLSRRIWELAPRHLHYVELFGGGLSVLLDRDPNDQRLWLGTSGDQAGVSEVVNDINTDLTNFWTVLQNPTLFGLFIRHVEAVPLSRLEFDNACEPLGPDDGYATYGGINVVWAVKFFVRARQSHAGTFKGFTALTRSRTRRRINGNASEWLGAVDGLPEVHARLRPVVIECMDAVKLLRREDGPGTFFYADPPYMHEKRSAKDLYAHEMTDEQHKGLLTALAGIEGKFILSGYQNPLYNDFAARHGWRREDVDIANHQAGGKAKRRMTESLWMNYEPERGEAP